MKKGIQLIAQISLQMRYRIVGILKNLEKSIAEYECRSNDKEDVKAVKIIGFQSANMGDDDTGLFMKETECQKRIAAVCPNVVNITDSASLYVEYDNSGRIRNVIRSKEELTGNPDNYRMFHFILMEKLKPILGYSASGKPYVLDEKMRMDENSRAGVEENILDFGIARETENGNASTMQEQEEM